MSLVGIAWLAAVAAFIWLDGVTRRWGHAITARLRSRYPGWFR